MARLTIDFGIDLGTTNSEIAVMDGIRPTIIKADDEKDYTPSCVWIDPKDKLYVGQRAKDRVLDDADNAFFEFKRDMGTTNKKTFKRSGKTLSPEELSAEVLKSLRENVRQRLNGEVVSSAVITVPAGFNMDAIAATNHAASMAGFTYCEILQEPIAAAIAYGFQQPEDQTVWMVYDFGGGTFDVAIIRMEGVFQVISHGGDNQLGGKDLDWAIIDQIIAPEVIKQTGISDFSRTNLKKYVRQFAKLKSEVEKVKIALSFSTSEEVFVPSLINDADFSYELTRAQVAELALPFIKESIEKCKQVITESGFKQEDIQKMILVGGPTKAPYLREVLSDPQYGLQIPMEYSVDPLTVVAEGAAIYSGGRKIGIKAEKTTQTEVAGVFQLEVNYKPIDSDDQPIIGIKILPPAGTSMNGYQMEVKGSNWSSGLMDASKGAVLFTARAERSTKNVYKIALFNAEGTAVKVTPDEITYIIGNAAASQTLTHHFGLALADDSPLWYFKKGDSLPTKKENSLRTSQLVKKGSVGDVISIPLIEGESKRASNNVLVGVFRITSDKITRDIPANSEIEVMIHIDESRIIQARAYIPILDMEFPQSIQLERKVLNPEEITADFKNQKKRFNNLLEKCRKNKAPGLEKLEKIESQQDFATIENKLKIGEADPQELASAQNKLAEIRDVLFQVDADSEWPVKVAEIQENIDNSRAIIEQSGNSKAKSQLVILEQEVKGAIEDRDLDLLERKASEIHSLTFDLLAEDIHFWEYFLEKLETEDLEKIPDKAHAMQLLHEGKTAFKANNLDGVRRAVIMLVQMLPPEARSSYGGTAFGSNVYQ